MASVQGYYYNQQLRRYIVQTMAVFSAIKVQVGWNEDKQPRLINIPVANASKDRVVAWIKGQQTQNLPIRLPMFTISLDGIQRDTSNVKGIGQTRRHAYTPTGGIFPDDITVINQRMPVPYLLSMSVTLWASNQDQHYQVVEQIATLFDPDLQLQTSDEIFDWGMINKLTLDDIVFEENSPAGPDRRKIQTVFKLTTTAYLAVPVDVHNKFVKDVFVRVGAVGPDAISNFDIIADLDEQNIEYTKIVDGENVGIDKTIAQETGDLIISEDGKDVLGQE